MRRVARRWAPLLPIYLGASAHPEQVSYRKPIPLAKNWRDAFRGINALVNQAIADRRVLFGSRCQGDISTVLSDLDSPLVTDLGARSSPAAAKRCA
jgi:hypothetical protein